MTLYELFVFRGTAYHELRQFQNAKRDAEKAIELQPTRADEDLGSDMSIDL